MDLNFRLLMLACFIIMVKYGEGIYSSSDNRLGDYYHDIVDRLSLHDRVDRLMVKEVFAQYGSLANDKTSGVGNVFGFIQTSSDALEISNEPKVIAARQEEAAVTGTTSATSCVCQSTGQSSESPLASLESRFSSTIIIESCCNTVSPTTTLTSTSSNVSTSTRWTTTTTTVTMPVASMNATNNTVGHGTDYHVIPQSVNATAFLTTTSSSSGGIGSNVVGTTTSGVNTTISSHTESIAQATNSTGVVNNTTVKSSTTATVTTAPTTADAPTSSGPTTSSLCWRTEFGALLPCTGTPTAAGAEETQVGSGCVRIAGDPKLIWVVTVASALTVYAGI